MPSACDYRVLFQGLSLILSVATLLIFLYTRIAFGRLSSSAASAIALAFHIMLFYLAICAREYFGVDIISIINNSLFGDQVLAYGDWSSAIRLQTVASVLLMALTVVRRERWINSVGLK